MTTDKSSRSILKQASVLLVGFIAVVSIALSSCSPSVARTAEARSFLDLSLSFIDDYQLPKTTFQDTPIGGLSALSYDRGRDRLYALSDDRSQFAPARFYTVRLDLAANDAGTPEIETLEVEKVTVLKDENGQTYAPGSIDPEGIALSPKATVYIASEGIPRRQIPPFIQEFDLETGQQRQRLRLPERYLFSPNTEEEARGVQENLGFESLALEPTSLAAASGDPFRLFAATESALLQDLMPDTPEQPVRLRFLHYLIQEAAPSILVSEHLYLLDPPPAGAIINGLTDVVALDGSGHFLSLERSYGVFGGGAKIYQLATGAATDTSGVASLKGTLSKIVPVQKKLLLDLSELGIYLDNLEGITLGPRLADGTQSVLVVSDDNFKEEQVTQFLLFSLHGS